MYCWRHIFSFFSPPCLIIRENPFYIKILNTFCLSISIICFNFQWKIIFYRYRRFPSIQIDPKTVDAIRKIRIDHRKSNTNSYNLAGGGRGKKLFFFFSPFFFSSFFFIPVQTILLLLLVMFTFYRRPQRRYSPPQNRSPLAEIFRNTAVGFRLLLYTYIK